MSSVAYKVGEWVYLFILHPVHFKAFGVHGWVWVTRQAWQLVIFFFFFTRDEQMSVGPASIS